MRAVHASRHAGYPIRTSADQGSCAPPRGFSQLVASFFAWRLHRHPPWTYVCLAISSFPPAHARQSGTCQISYPSLAARTSVLAAFLSSLLLSCQRSFRLNMGRDRVELSTPALSERCSNQLSYHPGSISPERKDNVRTRTHAVHSAYLFPFP